MFITEMVSTTSIPSYFCKILLDISNKIEEKASKIYTKQITKNKVLKYHCDFKKLEKVADEYKK